MALQTRTRVENPARWTKAAERAVAEGVQVRQLQGSGQWIATGGTQAGVAYEVAVTGNVAHGCDCLAGVNDDPVCKHRTAYYLLIGALAVDPEPDPPAPGALAPVTCFRCQGRAVSWPLCAGAIVASLVAQAAVLVAAAIGTCDHCGGPLDDDGETYDALITLCGGCIEAAREDAFATGQSAISAAHAQDAAERTAVAS